MAVLGDITKININGNELTIKDGALTDAVEQIVDAITDNNQVISERINNLNSRLETIEGSNFCTKDELIDDEEVIAETFNDINTRLEYAENNLGEINVIEGITFNGATASISNKIAELTYTAPVTSVNGQTGIVIIKENVRPNWAVDDSTSDAYIINKPHVTNIKTLYYNETTGLLATSTYSVTFQESLDGYDLIKCYFRPSNHNSSDSNAIPPAVLYIPLNEESTLQSGEFCGSVTIPYLNNNNRYAAYVCLINSTKTQFRVVSQTSLYGTAGSNISDASHGIYCYRIEAINTGNLIVENSEGGGGSFVESDPVFLASPAYNITSSDIEEWNDKVTSVNGQTGAVTIATGEANVIEAISFNGQTAAISGKTALILTDIEKTPLVTGTATSSVTIEPYKMYSFGTVSTSMTITYDTSKEVSGYCAQYMFRFVAGANCGITLPNGTKFEENGSNITFVTGRTYEYNITDGLCVIVEFL